MLSGFAPARSRRKALPTGLSRSLRAAWNQVAPEPVPCPARKPRLSLPFSQKTCRYLHVVTVHSIKIRTPWFYVIFRRKSEFPRVVNRLENPRPAEFSIREFVFAYLLGSQDGLFLNSLSWDFCTRSPDFWNGLDLSDRGSITRAPSRLLLRTRREYFWNTRAAFTRRDFVESPRSRMLESRCPSIEVANAADGNRGSIR